MNSHITQQQIQERKTYMAIMVTTLTSLVIVTSMLILSNLKPSEVFGASRPIKASIDKVSMIQHSSK